METAPSKQHITLAGKIVANILCLSHEAVTYYLSNLGEIPVALRRGFVLPGDLAKGTGSAPAPVIPEARVFPSAEAGLTEIELWSQFWLMFKIDFSKQLASIIPEKGRMYVVNPGTMSDQELVELLRPLVPYYLHVDLDPFSHSVASGKMTLRSFADSVEPDTEYLGRSAKDAEGLGLTWMTRAEYIIRQAFNVWRRVLTHDVRGHTIFPHQRLGEDVACGDWDCGRLQVNLSSRLADRQYAFSGPRLAKEVPLTA
jgi:hypothetical protein